MTDQKEGVVEVKKTTYALNEQLKNQVWQTNTGVFNPVIYQQFKVMANDMAKADALPKGLNAEQALVIMQFGSELGIKPFTSLQSIYIVNGKLVLYGSMVVSRLTQEGWKVEYEDIVTDIDDTNACILTVSKGKDIYSETYTFKMARESGYTGSNKPGWTKGTNRKLKLRYGAVSVLLKTKLPHLLNGAEIKEVWEDVEKVKVVGTTTSELDQESISKIQTATTVEELNKICGELKKTLPQEMQVSLVKYYGVRKEELNANN